MRRPDTAYAILCHKTTWFLHPQMAGSSTSKQSEVSKKRLPESIIELVDVAIYSFACQTGLRTKHKVRGDPVLEGVGSFLGLLLLTADSVTQQEFAQVSARLGGWLPGEMPTKELLTFVSSRMKTLKGKQAIREDSNPEVPNRLLSKKERFDEETDRVITRVFARCWRCGQRCECCRQKKNYPNFGNFRVE